MNMNSNPFGRQQQQQQINIDKLAEEMAETLRKLKQNPEKAPSLDRQDISDYSLGSAYPIRNVEEKEEVHTVKRSNPVQVIPLLGRKRVKAPSEYEGTINDDSQYIDSISNRKITQYYALKNSKPVEPVPEKEDSKIQQKIKAPIPQKYSPESEINQQQLTSHPVIKTLQQKLSRKQKSIEQLSLLTQKLRQKFQKTQQQLTTKKQHQRSILTELMSQKYDYRIYNQKCSEVKKEEHGCKIDKKILVDVLERIDLLKNQKGKKGKRGLGAEDVLEVYGEDRQNYLANWRKKLENQKTALEKEVLKVPLCEEIQLVEEKYYDLPQFMMNSQNKRIIFQKNYLPLYTRYQNDPVLQIRALNLSKLTHENLTILSYPKIARKQKRIQIKSHLKQIFSKSMQLNQQIHHALFLNSTIFTQIDNISQQFLVLGRAVWEEDIAPYNLKHMMKRYECIPQNIAKYIIKLLIRSYERIRRQTSHQPIILPQNILFNERNDIKIQNWILNEIFRFEQYGEFLAKDSKFLYLPPQYKIVLYNEDARTTGMGIWTIGVVLFQMVFGRKPFGYLRAVDHQEFFMMSQLEFPAKPQVSETCKQFIRLCLAKPQNRISFEKALKHPFFQSKK